MACGAVSDEGCTSAGVLAASDWLQVVEAPAGAVAAEVVERQGFIEGWAVEQVSGAVDAHVVVLAVSAHADLAVAVVGLAACPLPASCLSDDGASSEPDEQRCR